jgi:hypothetical protein
MDFSGCQKFQRSLLRALLLAAPVQSRENLIALCRISFQEIGMARSVANTTAGNKLRDVLVWYQFEGRDSALRRPDAAARHPYRRKQYNTDVLRRRSSRLIFQLLFAWSFINQSF